MTKIMFVSLGCDKNLVDTEKMLGILADRGFEFTDDENEADVAVVNTCTFIGDAKEESIQTLIDLGALKQNGRLKALIAAGCLAQRYHEEIRTQLPEVDAVVGTMAIESIADAVEAVLSGSREQEYLQDLQYLPAVQRRRIVSTPGGHYSYLKIAEGCDKCCTYCIIPKVRGRFRSVPMEDLVREAEALAAQGVKELILVAQETTLYGVDLYGKKCLGDLLRRLNEIPGLLWIRVLYCYPEEIDEELIRAMAECEKVVHYLDLPIQHADDHILKRMGRRTNQEELRRMIAYLRREIPDIALRTTLISGFPGETDEEHQELYRFVNEMEFDRLGVFSYSREEDTPAAGFPDQIPEEIREERRGELMELQQAISFEKSQQYVGQLLWCVIDGRMNEDDVYVGRTYRDAPDVDGYIFIKTDAALMTGDFVQVRVTDASEYDLTGEIYHESAE
ncbi:MAG: 30S ribosomal protein S12 methylthiotransferase RimO [Lachnospiraceae bacterium]|nr:30S ribosomal protein S12 methylthiotransferase RimO [Lachnospiraceae bacterium]